MKLKGARSQGSSVGGGASPGIFCLQSHRSQYNKMGATLAWPYGTVEGTNAIVRHRRVRVAARFYPAGGVWLRVSGSETNWFRSPV